MKRSRVVVMFHLLVLTGVTPVLATDCWSLEGDQPVTGDPGATFLYPAGGNAAVMHSHTPLALMVPRQPADLSLPRREATVSAPQSPAKAGLWPKALHKAALGRVGNTVCGFKMIGQGDLAAKFGQTPWMIGPEHSVASLLSANLYARPAGRLGRLPAPISADLTSRMPVGSPINFVWTWPVSAVESPPFSESP